MRLSIFFPFYNEEQLVQRTIHTAFEVLPKLDLEEFEVIAMNNASKDETGRFLDQLKNEYENLRVIHQYPPPGYGKALKGGFESARHPWIFFTDGDLQFDLNELPKLLEKAKETDLVIGYRIKRVEGSLRLLYQKLFGFLVRILFGLKVSDIDCAFKLIKKEIIDTIPKLQSDGAMISAELLIKAKRAGFKISEVPVHHYPDTAGGSTGGSPRVIWKAARELVKLWHTIHLAAAKEDLSSSSTFEVKFKRPRVSPLDGLRIGIDARFYGITGIGRYAKNLIHELEKLGTQNEYVIFLWQKTYNSYQPQNSRFGKVLADYPLYSFLEQIMMPIKIWQEKVDLMHFTNFNVPVFYFGKYVMTIHDLIHMEHSTFGSTTRFLPYYLLKKFIYSLSIRWAAFRAKKILVPSEDAKSDVVQKLWVKPEKVVVTYEGLDKNLKTQNSKLKTTTQNSKLILKKYGIKKPYLLYVGTMYPHKNHERLLLAFKSLIAIGRLGDWAIKLVLVAKVDFFSKHIKEKVEEMGLSDQVILPGFAAPNGYVPDEDLKIIYQNADVYVFPSLKEGFGLPILEAFAAGVPVVCSNISSLPEVAGNAAVYFNPYDVNDMVEKIKQILKNEELRNKLIEKGYERLKLFSWEKMAKETLKIYSLINAN